MFREEIIKNITKACSEHAFVSIVCDDGHEHTVKAFGNVCGCPFFDFENELDNQLSYCIKIAKGFDVEVLTANSFEEAVEKYILTEDGDVL